MDWQQLHESLTAVSSDLTEALELLRDTYLEDAQILVSRLKQSVESLDFERLRFTAHTLKSSSALMGAAALSEVCRQIEMKARQQESNNLSALVAYADIAQKRVAEILLAYNPDELSPNPAVRERSGPS